MIEDNSISYVNKIFCEWHHKKIGKDKKNQKKRHKKLIKILNQMGFGVTGDRKKDEFSKKYKAKIRKFSEGE